MSARKAKRTHRVTDQLVGRKVLLVEDSKTYVAAMAGRLEEYYGIEVVSCSSMDHLRETLANGGNDYSVAIADLNDREFEGQKLHVSEAQERKGKSASGGKGRNQFDQQPGGGNFQARGGARNTGSMRRSGRRGA